MYFYLDPNAGRQHRSSSETLHAAFVHVVAGDALVKMHTCACLAVLLKTHVYRTVFKYRRYCD